MIGHDEFVFIKWFVDVVFDTDWYLRRSNNFDIDSLSDDSSVDSEHDVR